MRAILRRSDDWEKEIDLDHYDDFELVVPTPLSFVVFQRTEETKRGLPVYVQVREQMIRR